MVVGGGTEFLDVTDEGSGEVGLVEVLLEQSGVSGAEAGVHVGDGHTAKAASQGRAVLAMERRGVGDDGGARASGFWYRNCRVENRKWNLEIRGDSFQQSLTCFARNDHTESGARRAGRGPALQTGAKPGATQWPCSAILSIF